MMRASATVWKSRSLPNEACTTITHSSRIKPLRSSNMSDRCPSLRCITGSIWTKSVQRRRRRETNCFISSPFCLDRGPPGRQCWRNDSVDSCSVKWKTISRMWSISVSILHGLPSIISHRLSKPTSCAAMIASPRSLAKTSDIASIF